MPQIQLISPFFPPSAASGAHRMLGFARHLPKFGWDVSVVASGPIPWESNDAELAKSVPVETKVTYVDYPLHRSRRPLPFIAQRYNWINGYHLWNGPAIRACKQLIGHQRPEVLLTSGPPHTVHLIGRTLKRRYGIPWVADFRDPWCSWGTEKRYTGKPPIFSKRWERSVFAEADLIVANTPNSAKMFAEVYPRAAERIISVPNGFDPPEFAENANGAVNGRSPFYTLLHTGTVYAGRDPRPLAKAVSSIGESRQLGERRPLLRLIGSCGSPEVSAELRSDELTSWVRMEEHVPYHESQAATRDADILVLFDSKDRHIGVPAKLYEYVGAKKPVLALAEQNGDTALVLRKCGSPYRIVSDWTTSSLQEAIISLADESLDRQAASPAASNGTHEEFTRQAAAGKLSKALKQLC